MALPQFHSIILSPFSTMTLPQLSKKKFHLFRQYHCHNYQKKNCLFQQYHCHKFFFFLTFSAIPLPQLLLLLFSYIFGNPIAQIFFFFFSSHFRQSHCHKFFFFSFPHIFGNPIATILFFFFSFNFRQSHCHNC